MRYATNKFTTLVPNNVARSVDFRERRAAPYNPSVERARLRPLRSLGYHRTLCGSTARGCRSPRATLDISIPNVRVPHRMNAFTTME